MNPTTIQLKNRALMRADFEVSFACNELGWTLDRVIAMIAQTIAPDGLRWLDRRIEHAP